MIIAAFLLLLVVLKARYEHFQARLEKTILSADQPNGVYVSGEVITFTCKTTKSPDSNSRFLLYKDGEPVSIEPTYNSERNNATFTTQAILTSLKDYNHSYTCYVLGRNAESDKSATVWIKVVDAPQKPRLLPDRADKVYVSDELITLNCTPPMGLAPISNYLLYKIIQQTPVNYQYYPWQSSATFTIRSTTTGRKGYHCVYASEMLGRNVKSEESERVQITVVDLPSSSLSLASTYVAQGEDVTFNCTSTKKISVGTFYLYKNGVRLNDTIPQSADAQNKSATFTIQNVDPGNSGNYTCVYKLLEADRYLTSVPSDSVLLYVSVNSIELWIPALAVVAPVLMLVVLGIYCWKKGKARRRRELRAVPSPKDDNIVYADVKVIPQTKKQKGKKERFEAHGDNSKIYADLKL